MKKTNVFIKMITMILTFTLLFTNMAPTALAASGNQNIDKKAIQLAKDVYQQLTPEGKLLFEKEMEKDVQLLEFHKKYVNNKYVKHVNSVNELGSNTMVSAAASNPLTVLSTELVKLNLPVAVRYSLMAMGGGLVAAGVDGPLPVGDLIAAVIAVGGVAVLAYYWTDISPKWDSIVKAFKTAFSTVTTKIDAIFVGLSITIDQYINTPYKKVNTDTYKITTKDSTLTITRDTSSRPTYYFAVRNPKGGITKVMPVTYSTALLIMKLGSGKVYKEGVYCSDGNYYAGRLAAATSSPGFDDGRSGNVIEAPHYHPGSRYSRNWGTHAWYALK